MRTYRIESFTKGWVAGDFEPSILKTPHAEFMVRWYKKGDKEARHVHKVADEITVIISGRFKMNGKELVQGDVVHLPPGTPAEFECLEDGANSVFKSPSAKGDKYFV